MGTLVTQMGPLAGQAMGQDFVSGIQQEQLANQFTGLLGGQNFNAGQMNATDVANLPLTVQHALEAIQQQMESAQPTNFQAPLGGALGSGVIGSALGSGLGMNADGVISNAEQVTAAAQISYARERVGQTLQEGGVGEAKDMINNLIRAAQVNAASGLGGGGDVQALQIAGLQTMLERLENQGTLNPQNNHFFFEHLKCKLL